MNKVIRQPNYNIIICTMPNSELRGPTMGPAVLKSYLETKGFSVKCIDYNIDLWHKIGKDKDYFVTIENNYFTTDTLFEEFYKEKRLDIIIHNWAKDLLAMNIDWIGISVHWEWNEKITRLLCAEIKRSNPLQKIVLGGSFAEFMCDELTEKNLIDAFIIGEGEEELERLLSGKELTGGRTTVADFSRLPPPDYSDYDLSLYPENAFKNEKTSMGLGMLYIQGSRSCVRKCTFCTIPQMFETYRFKAGLDIAKEMEGIYLNYGIKQFTFADNLINGNLKQFNSLLDALIDVQERNDVQFKWHAHYIIRSPKQIDKEMFKKIAKSGCVRLKIGIESGNEEVRRDMQKAFPTEFILFTVGQCNLHNIEARILLFAGYPTETKEKFGDTLELIRKLVPYKENVMLAVGNTAMVMTPSALSMQLHNIRKDERFGHGSSMEKFWIYEDNDIYERVRRHKEMVALAEELEFQVDDPLVNFTFGSLDKLRVA